MLGNRDYLKVTTPDGPLREPIWRFIDGQAHWLTSLVYLRNVQRPVNAAPGSFILDCGAWSYKHEAEPKWSPEQCVEKYATFAQHGDMVAAPDHMVLRTTSPEEELYRVDLTLENARRFLSICPSEWRPLGITHGNTLDVRMQMLRELLDMGYQHIAIGSVAIRAGSQRNFIRAILEDVRQLRRQTPFYVHVLGVSALSWYPEFAAHEIDSYDGSSMFLKAFTAGEYDWHVGDGKLISYNVKAGSADAIPFCECPPCAAMRAEDRDTRQMGSNESNMGRAVHNINQYLAALRAVQANVLTQTTPQRQSLWDVSA